MNSHPTKKVVRFPWPLVPVAVLLIGMASLASGRELSLTEAVNLALANHPDIQQAELRFDLAKLQLEAAQAKTSWPSLTIALSPSGSSLFSPQFNFEARSSFTT